MQQKTKADEVRRIEKEIRRLTQQLVELALESDLPELVTLVGARVRITRRDQYYGRVGRVTGLRERRAPAWYIELERKGTEPAVRIWKHEKYLEELDSDDETEEEEELESNR